MFHFLHVLVAGSIPERSGEKLYNTSMSFGQDGRLLGIYRKVSRHSCTGVDLSL